MTASGGPAGPAILPIQERSEYRKSTRSYGSRAHPRLGHLDFADFHLRDAAAERDTRGRDRLPEGLRLRLQVGGVLVGTDPNELVLRPIDPGRHDRPADLVVDRLGLFFEVLDEVVQLALVDGVNADLCLHLLCLHSLREVLCLGILSGKKSHACLLTAIDLPPPCTRLLLILARSMTKNQGPKNGAGMPRGLKELHPCLTKPHGIGWGYRNRPVDAKNGNLERAARRDRVPHDQALGHVKTLDRRRAGATGSTRQFAIHPDFGIIVNAHRQHDRRTRTIKSPN